MRRGSEAIPRRNVKLQPKEGTIKLNESGFFNLLEERAKSIQHDIEADHPEQANNTGYDLYVQELENGEIVGVIDMGDLYAEVFMDMHDGTIETDPSLDPHDVIERIFQFRVNGRWPEVESNRIRRSQTLRL